MISSQEKSLPEFINVVIYFLMDREKNTIAVFNAGSSSLKCALFEENTPEPLWKGHFPAEAFLEALEAFPTKNVAAVGHRVVHGGRKFHTPVVITDSVKQQIRALEELAPLHNAPNLAGIEFAEKAFPAAVQYAVFDTAFHITIPEAASTYPGPFEWKEWGIKRYGFHGISHKYCSGEAARCLGRQDLKLVTCHLGAGASLTAVQSGRSIDTTMGFTPLEGLMMCTRSGSVDPGILFHLITQKKMDAELLDKTLNHASGLLGISGLSEDMREVLQAAQRGHTRAHLAVEIYLHRLKSCIGSMAASLGGLDVLVFTAGIGENSSEIRARCCRDLAFLGVELDEDANETDAETISTPHSSVKVLVIPTREEWAIVQEGTQLLENAS